MPAHGLSGCLFALALARVGVVASATAYGFDAALDRPFAAWVYLVQVGAFSIASVWLWFGGRRERRAASLGLFYALVASSFAHPYLRALATELADVRWMSVPLTLLADIRPEAFLAAGLWMFVSVFPASEWFVPAQRVATLGLRVSLALGFVLLAGDFLSIHGPDTWRDAFQAFSSQAATTSWYWAVIFYVGFPALGVILWKARLASLDERRRLAWFIGGIVAGLMPTTAITVAARLIPAVRDWEIEHFAMLGWVFYPSLLSVPLVTAYSVAVDRVVDVRFALGKALQYAFARYTLTAAAAAPVLWLATNAYRHRDLTLAEFVAQAGVVPLVAMSAAALGAFGLRGRLMPAIDRLFFREIHAAGPVLARFAEASRGATTTRGVARALEAAVEQALHPGHVAVLMEDPRTKAFGAVSGSARPLSASSALATMLRASAEAVQTGADVPVGLTSLLPCDERQWVADNGVTVIVPLHSGRGDLSGLVLLGQKRSDLEYSAGDLAMLKALGASAASAMTSFGIRAADGNTLAVAAVEEIPAECVRCGRILDENQRRCPCGGGGQDAVLPRVLHGKFILERRIGAGGMGIVYQARDETLDRRVAVKTLPRLSPEAVARMRREAKAMALVTHPGLAVIYQADSWRGLPFLVMEYLDGGSLADRLQTGPADPVGVLDMGIRLCEALGHLHAAGLLHRDIKPSNIAFMRDGGPKLLDFGLARLVIGDESDAGWKDGTDGQQSGRGWRAGSSVTGSGRIAGTPAYVAPEALAGARPSPLFDLWSLALVLYEAATGTNPVRATTLDATLARVREGHVPLARDVRPVVPEPLEACLAGCLARDPHDRPASAHAMRSALAACRQLLSQMLDRVCNWMP